MSKAIYPCLWFETQAKEAAEYYCNIFPNSKILDASPIVVNVELNGKHIMLLNGKPQLPFNESFSFVIPCDDQKEIDYYIMTNILSFFALSNKPYIRFQVRISLFLIQFDRINIKSQLKYVLKPFDIKQKKRAMHVQFLLTIIYKNKYN